MNQFIQDFLHVTESAALATYPWIGTGNKIEADQAATDSMRTLLNKIPMDGEVVIGEGEMDEAPMLFIGEKVGTGNGAGIDLAVDPIDGTTSTSKGKNNAIAVIAAAKKGTLLHAPDMYMEKLVTGPEAAGKIDIDYPLEKNLRIIADAKEKKLEELKMIVQDRERHNHWIEEARALGVRTELFEEGDVIPAIATCIHRSDIDLFIGIGGAPEGVLAAVGVKSLGGEMQARLLPKTDEQWKRCVSMGITNPKEALGHNQLVGTNECAFIATSITSNMLLQGIENNQNVFTTHSIVLDGLNKCYRHVATEHTKSPV
ncbi:class II fructose-bisphosphatase [Oceanobacillus neutriphilus]|uniref:Fructose-1,6-bisphosphatase n=1 Tax=Oceanobacillus neutriphilus TaxID=531815 RepID=A0ABQ2P0Z4_9BACI|nr:class II fructose-bisphosphatase [Oceanobacillus neutriphilus]GGP15435.1 fructose-1,6-bisphosphatase [Oceanobacillus neutriphilus]